MSEVKYTYTYDKDNDTVEVSKQTTFNFTHYHRDLLLEALTKGYVEVRGKFLEAEEYTTAFYELTEYNLLKSCVDSWYNTGKIVNKEVAIRLVKAYSEE